MFNYANLVVYHYAANNPLKYVDPDGRQSDEIQAVPPASADLIGQDVEKVV